LNNIEVQEAENGLRGITWLELYILYRCRGHGKPIADPENAAKARTTPAKQIAKFKKETKKVIKLIGASSHEQRMFNTSTARSECLLGVAVKGKHPQLGFNVVVSAEEEEAMTNALIKITRQIN